MKKVLATRSAPGRHWVGNGLVHGMFELRCWREPSAAPFPLLDYAAPTRFEPTSTRRGVGQHPHRGFETVTIVYDGEVEHRDSTGQGGVIGPGDVQWMTAGAGIPHEEFHPPTTPARWPVRDGAAVGQPAGQGQDGRARLPGDPERRHPGAGPNWLVKRPACGVIAGEFDGGARGPARTPSRRSTCGTCATGIGNRCRWRSPKAGPACWWC